MNRLTDQTSPYLRQHAGDPVDWHAWGDEAFAEAERLDRPVMLSVGYSACHWCHVMAHESFQDEETAHLLNDSVVSIKVDREERPDIDALYMEAVTATTGGGGWPMTVFLTPDRRPFFAGTYFPPVATAQMPAFKDVVTAVARAWTEQRSDIELQASRLTEAVSNRLATAPADDSLPPRSALDVARSQLIDWHDSEWGGFGAAPKFPQTMSLELLMRLGDEASMKVVKTSLDSMAAGGIYDHVGGGFHRYSVDAFWMVPHFEKMLYDQALLARTYLHAFQLTDDPSYRQVCTETLDYVLRDLRAPDGAFYTAEDADSEGEEGLFYIWRPEEIAVVTGEDAEEFAAWYGVTKAGNFEGSNILHRPEPGKFMRSDSVERARNALLERRSRRTRPGLDDKVVAETNAMFISTLAEAGAALGRGDLVDFAETAADALIGRLRDEKGRWLRSAGAPHLAFAIDYAHLIDAFIRLSEATGSSRWRNEAISTANAMLELFWDDIDGGLFTGGNDSEALLVRSKEIGDAATPSANGTAAMALERLGRITDDDRYIDCAKQIVCLGGAHLAHQPSAFPSLLATLDSLSGRTTETVIAGDHSEMVRAVQQRFLPNNVLVWGDRDDLALWEGRVDGGYVCSNKTCGPRHETAASLLDELT